MKLLILTQYFPPEVGAPQNRLYELAVLLQKKGIEVNVLTAMPNYPQMEIHEGYKGKWYIKENMDGLNVFRAYIYSKRTSSLVLRLLNYFSFVVSSLFVGLFRLPKTDFVFCESPPLFLGITAYLLRLFKGKKLIFNVSDLWPESAEKLGLVNNKALLGLSTLLEEFMYKRSALVTGQTQGIVQNIAKRFPKKKVYWLPNGVDLNYFTPLSHSDWRIKNGFSENDFILLYAGILGYAQGLEIILHAAAQFTTQPNIKFMLLGSGPEKEKLMQLKNQLSLSNVYFQDAVSKKEMPGILCGIQVALIPLKKLDLFKGAIPSKIFENLAMKKAILLGVEGEAKELFIDEAKAGMAFTPEDHLDLAAKISWMYNHPKALLEYGENGRQYVAANFNRPIIAEQFYKTLVELHTY